MEEPTFFPGKHPAIKNLKISWKGHIFDKYKAEILFFCLPRLLLYVITL